MSLRRRLPSRIETPAEGGASASVPETPKATPLQDVQATAVVSTPAVALPTEEVKFETSPTPVAGGAMAALAAFGDPIAAEPLMPSSDNAGSAAPAVEEVTAPSMPAQDQTAAPETLATAPAAENPETATPETPAAPPAPSLPDEGMVRRKVRVKEPRQFKQPDPEPEAPAAPAPVAAPEAVQRVEDADDRLAAAGVMAAPPADVLTQNMPAALAVEPTDISATPEAVLPAAALHETALSAPVDVVVPVVPVLPTVPSPLLPAAVSASSSERAAPLPAASSDLPWANPSAAPEDSGWSFPLPDASASQEGSAQPSSPQPPSDVFNPATLSNTVQAFHPNAKAGGTAASTPPEIMATSKRIHGPSTSASGGGWQLMAAAAAVAAVVGAAYWFVARHPDTPQMVAMTPAAPQATSPTTTLGLLPPPVENAQQAATFNPLQEGPVSSTAQIAFTNVPQSEANQPVVATGQEKMPEDVSFIANLQQAIAAEKNKKAADALGAAEASTEGQAAPTDKIARLEQGKDLKQQLDAELAAYRQALASTPKPLAPKPGEFFDQSKNGYMNGAQAAAQATTVGQPSAAVDEEGAPSPTDGLLPPPTAAAGAPSANGGLPPPNELYADNPAHLPVVGQPSSAEAPRVRQLTDFNVSMFEPEKDKIRIPQGVKPRLASSDFPSMEVLSFVPGKGLIAYKDGKEGVLLIGEEMDGWKLESVSTDVAEFRNGRRTQYVSAD